MSEGPLAQYRGRLKAGDLRPDPAQELAAEKLESLYHALAGYRAEPGQPAAPAGKSGSGWPAAASSRRRGSTSTAASAAASRC